MHGRAKLLFFGVAPLLLAASDLELGADATQLVQALAAGKLSDVTDRFDGEMARVLPRDKLAEAWSGVQGSLGAFVRIHGLRSARAQGYDIVFVTCQMERSGLDVQLVFDSKRRISGLFLHPNETLKAVPKGPQRQAASASVGEIEVEIGQDPWRLPGTLSLPTGKGPFPALVLVHGSGPQDRDETIGPNKPFKDLAAGLMGRGVAVLRYDKRTKVHGAKMVTGGPSSITIDEEVVDDALAAVELLARRKDIDASRIYVLGHSLGGTLAPRIASRSKKVRGLVIMAGATRPLSDLIVEQVEYIAGADGKISSEEKEQIAAARILRRKVEDPNLSAEQEIDVLGAKTLGAYWLSLRAADPKVTAAGLSLPVLVLQGERDYQVTMEDFGGWKRILKKNKHARFISYPKLNHLFMAGQGRSSPAEYAQSGHVDRDVIEDIAKFVGSKAGR